MATQATRVRKVKRVWSVLKVQLAHKALAGYKVKMERKENKDHLDLKVTWDHMDLLVRREREASRVIWDLQVHKEKLVKEETWDRKVNLVRKV